MSWTDKTALDQFKKLRDVYNIRTFIETGTFMGVGAAVHSHNFKHVVTCEVNPEYYKKAKKRLKPCVNVTPILGSSPDVLPRLKSQYVGETVFVYLDAHFYDPSLPKDDRWVIVKELQAMKGWETCVIAIHDFGCNGLGHLCYDGQHMDFPFLYPYLKEVNPNFHYYCNARETCDIITAEGILSGEVPGLYADFETLDNLEYAWSSEEKTYRGILYCTPTELDLSQFQLSKVEG